MERKDHFERIVGAMTAGLVAGMIYVAIVFRDGENINNMEIMTLGLFIPMIATILTTVTILYRKDMRKQRFKHLVRKKNRLLSKNFNKL